MSPVKVVDGLGINVVRGEGEIRGRTRCFRGEMTIP